jgi:hypothetical protein
MAEVKAWRCDDCGKLLIGWDLQEHACTIKDLKFYLVGVLGDIDPDYWFARFKYIPAKNEQEAITKWMLSVQGWLRSDEVRHIKVWDTQPIKTRTNSKGDIALILPSVYDFQREWKAKREKKS